MIAQNSEVYNPPTYLFSLYTYMEKDLCRGLYTSLFCVIIPTLFPYFLPFWYPYILLHFQMFFITLEMKAFTSSPVFERCVVEWGEHAVASGAIALDTKCSYRQRCHRDLQAFESLPGCN